MFVITSHVSFGRTSSTFDLQAAASVNIKCVALFLSLLQLAIEHSFPLPIRPGRVKSLSIHFTYAADWLSQRFSRDVQRVYSGGRAISRVVFRTEVWLHLEGL